MVMAMGSTTSGSLATRRTRNPGGTFMAAAAFSGDSGAVWAGAGVAADSPRRKARTVRFMVESTLNGWCVTGARGWGGPVLLIVLPAAAAVSKGRRGW